MESVLITGASGFLGSNVAHIAKDRYEVISTDLYPIEGWDIKKLDITNRENCIKIFKKYKPDLVIHCAANLNMGSPEELMRKVNAEGTKNIADACKVVDAKRVYISTDWVFDGKKKGGEKYTEDDKESPVNIYGKTKFEGELFVRASDIEWIVARPANIYGVNWIIPREKALYEEHVAKRGGLAVQTIYALRKGEEIKQPPNVWQTPTLASHLAETILQLYEKGQTGIFHVSGRQCIRRHQFFVELAKMFNLNESLVKPCGNLDFAKSFGTTLPVDFPKNSCLDVSKVEKVLGRKQLEVREGLAIMKTQFEEIERLKPK